MMYILFVVLLVFILALHCGVKPVELYVNCKEKKYNERKTSLEEGTEEKLWCQVIVPHSLFLLGNRALKINTLRFLEKSCAQTLDVPFPFKKIDTKDICVSLLDYLFLLYVHTSPLTIPSIIHAATAIFKC